MASEQVPLVQNEEKPAKNDGIKTAVPPRPEAPTENTLVSKKPVAKRKSGIPFTGMERGFYQHMMNPLMGKMEESINKNNELLDEINRKLKAQREKELKQKQQAHIPEILHNDGQEMKSIMEHLENLIVYENYDKEEKDADKLVKSKLKDMDENSQAAILSHGMAAYISTLEPSHLRHFADKITSDLKLWLSRLFRFDDSSVCYHDDEREGLVRIARLVLNQKYPKFSTDGYEALYSKPPVIYISSAAKPGLGQYICAQMGLPLSSLCSVPCGTKLGETHKMDIPSLEKLLEEDVASGKTPCLMVAYAGTPVIGHTDRIDKLTEICKKHEMWFHLEGTNLACLVLDAIPTNVKSAKAGDSMTLNIGGWLGIPGIPYATMYKSTDLNLSRAAGLSVVNSRYKLSCLPLWVCLQNLGFDGIVSRIKYACDLAKLVHEKIDKIPTIRDVSKKVQPPSEPAKKEEKTTLASGLGGLADMITRAISAFITFETHNPTVVFRYSTPETKQDGAGVSPSEDDENQPETVIQDPYYDALNVWLSETLRRDFPKVYVTNIHVEHVGICIRFSPMETVPMFDTNQSDVEDFTAGLERQLTILNATVHQRAFFQDIVEAQDNLRLVSLPSWAGLGAVQYIPENWLAQLESLPDNGKQEINNLNVNLVHQLKSADTAFSLGETEDGLMCVRFGLITSDTDLEELIGLVYTSGKEVEESSKFLETMADNIRQGIEIANSDLQKETQEKLAQEGVLRQVPLIGSMINWWSPPRKDIMKGRTFNLASGKIESTESTYKYHIQVQEETPEPSPKPREGSFKDALKPSKHHKHDRSASEISNTSLEVAALDTSDTASPNEPVVNGLPPQLPTATEESEQPPVEPPSSQPPQPEPAPVEVAQEVIEAKH